MAAAAASYCVFVSRTNAPCSRQSTHVRLRRHVAGRTVFFIIRAIKLALAVLHPRICCP